MFGKSRKLLELASGSQIDIMNLYEQDEQNKKKHSCNCKKHGHMECDCLFCDLTYEVYGIN